MVSSVYSSGSNGSGYITISGATPANMPSPFRRTGAPNNVGGYAMAPDGSGTYAYAVGNGATTHQYGYNDGHPAYAIGAGDAQSASIVMTSNSADWGSGGFSQNQGALLAYNGGTWINGTAFSNGSVDAIYGGVISGAQIMSGGGIAAATLSGYTNGGTSYNAHIYSGGYGVVGGGASGFTIKGQQLTGSNGYFSGGTLDEGSYMAAGKGGTVTNVSIAGDYLTQSASTTFNNIFAGSAATAYVMSGGVFSNNSILSGATANVSGGTVQNLLVSDGGTLMVEGGNYLNVLNSGLDAVHRTSAPDVMGYTSGTAVSPTIGEGSLEIVNSDGVISGGTVSGGTEIINSGGADYYNTVLGGGSVIVSGGLESHIKLRNGFLDVESGGTVTDFSGVTGVVKIASAGRVAGGVGLVGSGSVYVSNGGTTDFVDIGGGYVSIDQGVNIGGSVIISGDGSTDVGSNANISGALTVQGGGKITLGVGDTISGAVSLGSGTMLVGDNSIIDGALSVAGSGYVSAGVGENIYGGISLATGSVSVNSSSLVSGSINVTSGNGIVNLGSSDTVSGDVTIASAGTAMISGGAVIDGQVSVGGSGYINLGAKDAIGSSVTLGGGGSAVVASGVTIGGNLSVNGNLAYSSGASAAGSVMVSNGTWNIGGSAGGDLIAASGSGIVAKGASLADISAGNNANITVDTGAVIGTSSGGSWTGGNVTALGNGVVTLQTGVNINSALAAGSGGNIGATIETGANANIVTVSSGGSFILDGINGVGGLVSSAYVSSGFLSIGGTLYSGNASGATVNLNGGIITTIGMDHTDFTTQLGSINTITSMTNGVANLQTTPVTSIGTIANETALFSGGSVTSIGGMAQTTATFSNASAGYIGGISGGTASFVNGAGDTIGSVSGASVNITNGSVNAIQSLAKTSLIIDDTGGGGTVGAIGPFTSGTFHVSGANIASMGALSYVDTRIVNSNGTVGNIGAVAGGSFYASGLAQMGTISSFTGVNANIIENNGILGGIGDITSGTIVVSGARKLSSVGAIRQANVTIAASGGSVGDIGSVTGGTLTVSGANLNSISSLTNTVTNITETGKVGDIGAVVGGDFNLYANSAGTIASISETSGGISGGTFDSMGVISASTMNIQIQSGVGFTADDSVINVSGGNLGSVGVVDGSTMVLSGASVNALTGDASNISLTSGASVANASLVDSADMSFASGASGGSLYVLNGAVASVAGGATVTSMYISGGSVYLSSGANVQIDITITGGNSTTQNNMALNGVYAASPAYEGALYVGSGMVMDDIIGQSNALIDVSGTTNDAAAGSASTIMVHKGGTVGSALASGASSLIEIASGGSIQSATIQDGAGGSIASGAALQVLTISAGSITVASGATLGTMFVSNGATATLDPASVVSLVDVYSGGVVSGAHIGSGAEMVVYAGGTTVDTLINGSPDTALDYVSSGATAINTIISGAAKTEARLTIESGAVLSNTSIGQHGEIVISGLKYDAGGYTYVQGGTLYVVEDGQTWSTGLNGVYRAGTGAKAGATTGSADDFYLLNDGNGNTMIVYTCFLPGSMIRLEQGEVAVEHVKRGDKICVFVDGREEIRTVKTVRKGMTKVETHQPDDIAGWAVQIDKDAFAPNVPNRDLFVTPEHCFYFEGRFIPARMLVNGQTIRYDKSQDVFDYYHVETEQHSVIWANNALTESYLETGERLEWAGSDNGEGGALGQFVQLHPLTWEKDAAVPLEVSREFVEPIHKDLVARAHALGHIASEQQKEAQAGLADPDLRLLLEDGRVIEKMRERNGRVVFNLPTDARNVRILSRHFRPTEMVGPFLDDRRSLGVLIGEISLWTGEEETALTTHLEAEMLAGWGAKEHAEHRWTTGDALLPLPKRRFEDGETVLLSLQIKGGGPYSASQAERPALEGHDGLSQEKRSA